MAVKEIALNVGELTSRDESGRGIIRISTRIMNELGIREGDVVELSGQKKTGAIAVRAYPADVGLSIVRMDGITRMNAGVGVGETVRVRKADVKEAKRVVLAPAQKDEVLQLHPDLLKRNLFMRPAQKGDVISPFPVVRRQMDMNPFEDIFRSLGINIDELGDFAFTPVPGETKLVVVSTIPEGIVKITEATQIELRKEAVEIEAGRVPSITYEDIGGLHGTIEKIREMVELPMRHPELFTRLGIDPPKGVLLYGPPGTGKTLLAKAVATESGAHFYSIAGPEIMSKWYGQSLPPGENIMTFIDGAAKVEGIDDAVRQGNSTHVISFDGSGMTKISKVKSFIEHPSNGSRILEVRTATGRKIRVTDYHSLFTLKDGKITDVKTSELVPELSYVAVPSSIPAVQAIDRLNLLEVLRDEDHGLKIRNNTLMRKAVEILGTGKSAQILGVNKRYVHDLLSRDVSVRASKFIRLMSEAGVKIDPEKISVSKNRKKEFPAVIKFDVDFSFLVGIWLAEGDYNKGSVRIHNNLPEVREFVKTFCRKYGIHVTFYEYSIIMNSALLRTIFEKIIGLRGGDATKKYMPPMIFSLKKTSLAHLLRGYFTGDGSIYPNQRGVFTIEGTTYSERLANDLLYVLLYFGIVASDCNKEGSKKHRILVRGMKNFRKFKEIGFLDKKRGDRIGAYLASRKWERSDQIPVWKDLEGIIEARMHEWKGSPTIGRDKLLELLTSADPTRGKYPDAWKIAEAEIYWDKVKEIKPVEYEGPVFDISVNPTENFLGGFGGIFAHNTEENLRKIFEDAEKSAPSIIFIDEIDAIAPKREEVTGEVEKRTVSQLLSLMDGLKARGKVIVIAATNMPNSIDPALRRPGRFDREIEIGVPDAKGRKEILQIHTRNMPLDDVDLNWLAEVTHGFVGADLEALAKEAAMSALRRNLPQISWKKEDEIPQDILKRLKVGRKDFENALKMVEPSAMREIMIEIPNVKWNDIGGLEEVKQSLKEIVEWPMKNPDAFEKVGIRPPKGILMYGPPGTGKTLLAKAVASESGANFISIRGPEVLSKWVGESEKHVRDIFKRAKQVAPSIVFFDEMDALVPRRGLDAGSRVSENVVSQILTAMSGVEEMHNVVVIGATNRPDILDPALLRPGRFDRQVLVPAPDAKARLEVLKIHTRKMPLKGVDIGKLAKQTEGYSGADIEALCREAGINAIREIMAKSSPKQATKAKKDKGKAKDPGPEAKDAKESKPDAKAEYAVTKKHFDEAMKQVKPSITSDMLRFYEKILEEFKSRGMERKKAGRDDTDYVE